MNTYKPSQATPRGNIPELERYLFRELNRISASMDTLNNPITTLYAEPERPAEGEFQIADGTTWNPGSGFGLYQYLGGSWVFLSGITGGGGVTSVGTGTGLTGGPITTVGTVSLADTAVTAGSYTLSNLTVDPQGRITAITNGTETATTIYNTVADVIADTLLVAGDWVTTKGYTTAGDGGGATYLISASQVVDGYGDHTLANGTVALLSDTNPTANQYGAVSGADSTQALDAYATARAGKKIIINEANNFLYSTSSGSFTLSAAGTRIEGGGKITALDSDNHLVLISGGDCVVTGCEFEGDGTFTSDKAIPNGDRIALIKVTGDGVEVSGNILTNGHQSFINYDTVTSGYVGLNKLYGGIATYNPSVDTGYQGVRVTDSSHVLVHGNEIFGDAGNKTAEAIYVSAFSTTVSNNNIVSNNVVHFAWDHGVYLNVSHNSQVINNITNTDAAGIVCASLFDITNTVKYQGNICTGNSITASAVPTGTVGLSFRDANDSLVAGNNISGFGRGIQLSPVTYSTANLTINNNIITDNIIRDVNDTGIIVGGAGLTVGEVKNNRIENNIVVGKALASAVGCSFIFGAGISKSNSVVNNEFVAVGDIGCNVQSFDLGDIRGNKIIDPARAAAGNKIGIQLISSSSTTIENNTIVDTLGTPEMLYGISGNNTSDNCSVRNNLILNAKTVPIRQFQFGGNKNTFTGNKTGDDSLSGVATLSAATNTTVANDNINGSLGMTSRVLLSPINQSAATLVSGANSPFVADGDYVAGVSFKVRQAGSAVGTEQFFYEIIQ